MKEGRIAESRAPGQAIAFFLTGLLLALAVVAGAVWAEAASYAQSSPAGGQPSAEAQAEGDPDAGKNLFTGTSRFQNDGPPCMACHSVAGIGALGGGALGPDLTTTAWKGPALAGFLDVVTNPNMADTYPTMNAVWGSKALFTPEEKANLGAFLQQAPLQARSTQAVWQLTGLALAGVTVAAGLVHLVWRHRLRNVRKPMVAG
ncbi:MAG: c-type cytochrome [Chloroflexi bacterium]|nr:c-type cytochrome [Chloroflexota bacterium]